MEDMEIKEEQLFSNFYSGKRVLITGDTGFKGSWLAIWLHEMGANVYGYSLPPLTKKDNFARTDLGSIINHKDGDIRDSKDLLNYFTEVKPEIVFHLAAQPLVLESYKNPNYTFETNLMGTVNLFDAVRKTGSVKIAINITSDKCYDNKEWVWGYRESDPMGGKDPYSASKGGSEIITASYLHSFFSNNHTANIASARAGNVIGGGDWARDRIIPDFFRSLVKGESLVIRNPQAIRPWQHVLEPLSGYLLLAVNLYIEGKKYSGGWNFGPLADAYYTVEMLISKIIKKIGDGELTHPNNQNEYHEANFLRLEISKAIHHLHWAPTLKFEETVDFTATGYKSDLYDIDIYRARVKQIKEFIRLSKKRNAYLTKKNYEF